MGFWEAFRGRGDSRVHTSNHHLPLDCSLPRNFITPGQSGARSEGGEVSQGLCARGLCVCVSMCFAASPCLVTR